LEAAIGEAREEVPWETVGVAEVGLIFAAKDESAEPETGAAAAASSGNGVGWSDMKGKGGFLQQERWLEEKLHANAN
jgi:hypothetical protein